MGIIVRTMKIEETEETGKIIVESFNDVFVKHGLPAPFQSWQAGRGLAYGYARHDPEGCLIATENGKIIGSGFIHLRGETASIGPVSVSPEHQSRGVGRIIMEALMEIGSKASSIRLIQDSFNTLSFSLYTKLGFQVHDVVLSLLLREPGDFRTPSPDPEGNSQSEREIRLVKKTDLPGILALDKQVMGYDRTKDFTLLINEGVGLINKSRHSDQIDSYIFCYLYRENNLFIGPGVAFNMDYLFNLLAELIKRNAGAWMRVKIFAGQSDMPRFLLDSGFKIIGIGAFMVKGNYERSAGRQFLAQFPEVL